MSHPTGRLIVHLRTPPGLISETMMFPVLLIDGYPAPARWGDNALLAPAGTRHVDVRTRSLYEFGRAGLPVVVHPGQDTHVFYSPPYATFSPGAIGFEPQRRNGAWVLALLITVPLLVLVLVLTMTVVLGN